MHLCFFGQVSTVEELRRHFAAPAETREAPAAAETPVAAEAPAGVETLAAPLPDAEESKQKRLAAGGGQSQFYVLYVWIFLMLTVSDSCFAIVAEFNAEILIKFQKKS